MNEMKYSNPFYDNHQFTSTDLDRLKLTVSDKLEVLFCPMKVAITSDGTWYYKIRGGRYYFFKYEPLPDRGSEAGEK